MSGDVRCTDGPARVNSLGSSMASSIGNPCTNPAATGAQDSSQDDGTYLAGQAAPVFDAHTVWCRRLDARGAVAVTVVRMRHRRARPGPLPDLVRQCGGGAPGTSRMRPICFLPAA